MKTKTGLALFVLTILLALSAISCARDPAPVIVEKEVIIEVVKEIAVIKEVVIEVEKPVIVTKEVVKEVVKEILVTATPPPAVDEAPVEEIPWISAEVTTLNDAKWKVWYWMDNPPIEAVESFGHIFGHLPQTLIKLEVAELENGQVIFRIVLDFFNVDGLEEDMVFDRFNLAEGRVAYEEGSATPLLSYLVEQDQVDKRELMHISGQLLAHAAASETK